MLHLLAADEALTGGGIVGGVVTAAGALYVIWEKWSRRKSEERKEAIANEAEELKLAETKIKIDQMARDSLSEAFDQEREARKAAHDADIRAIRREIEEYQRRLADLESREKECQSTCTGLKHQCAGLKQQNAEQAREMAELRDHIARLEKKLKDAGALPPGTDHHEPLR